MRFELGSGTEGAQWKGTCSGKLWWERLFWVLHHMIKYNRLLHLWLFGGKASRSLLVGHPSANSLADLDVDVDVDVDV